MKAATRIFALALCCALLAGCSGSGKALPDYIPTEKIPGSSLYVKKTAELPADFILGMDVSSLPSLEESGVRFYDFDGGEQDLLQTLAENGVNCIRVRVWNDPYDANGNGFGGGNCDAEKAAELGRRAAQFGLGLIVDFHYSDFWADPGKQMAPRAWAGMEPEEKASALYEFTRDTLRKIRDSGVEVRMVQLGNETNGAMCGETDWDAIAKLMQAGSRAVRETFSRAKVAVHFTNPENTDSYAYYARALADRDVDYDVFASSYYPFWHGTLENLADVLSRVAAEHGKQVMVMETSYARTAEDTDFFPNTISDESRVEKPYPYTVQGQANAFRDVVDTVAGIGGIGVVYWEGAWISAGGASRQENSTLWQNCGSGWAASYAKVYDPDDAGRYYGGSAVDNQAMFDHRGRPLESLRVFNLVRFGNEIAPVPDAVEETACTADVDGEILLPETVEAVMTDNTRQSTKVAWNVTSFQLWEMQEQGPGEYVIKGRAGSRDTLCRLTLVKSNLLKNGSFESGDYAGWRLYEFGRADQLYAENKASDSLDGPWHFHFWSSEKNTVDFALEQTADDLPAGGYEFTISIMGGDCGEAEITAYIKVDGEIAVSAPLTVTGFGNWDTARVRLDSLSDGQKLTVGIAVKAAGEGRGAWGKIDAASLCALDQ